MRFGRGALMAKFDLWRAYRFLPVSSQDRQFLGMKWRNQFYIDLALPFGLRSSPRIFTRFADVLQSIFQQNPRVNASVQHYLDDFFLVGKPNSLSCQESLETCFQLSQQLGVPWALDKTEGPTTCITFLGLELDLEKLELRVPNEKLDRIRQELQFWVSRRSATKRKLLLLIELLQFCCQAVVLGRPFLRRLIDRASTVSELHHYVSLSSWEGDDIKWWHSLLTHWNGRSLFLFDK